MEPNQFFTNLIYNSKSILLSKGSTVLLYALGEHVHTCSLANRAQFFKISACEWPPLHTTRALAWLLAMHPLLFIPPGPTYGCSLDTYFVLYLFLSSRNLRLFLYKPLILFLSFTGKSDLTANVYRTSTEIQEATHRVEHKTDRDHLSLRRSTSKDNESREEGTSTDNIPSSHGIPARNPPVEWSDSVDITSTRGSSHGECSGGGDGDSSSPSHDAILGTIGKPQLQQQQSEGVVSGRSGDHSHENRSPATRKVAKRAWEGVKVVMERALHVFREVKAVFSSELERCLLKVSAASSCHLQAVCPQGSGRVDTVEGSDTNDLVCGTEQILVQLCRTFWLWFLFVGGFDQREGAVAAGYGQGVEVEVVFRLRHKCCHCRCYRSSCRQQGPRTWLSTKPACRRCWLRSTDCR